MAPSIFGLLVNPIPTGGRGADYANHITNTYYKHFRIFLTLCRPWSKARSKVVTIIHKTLTFTKSSNSIVHNKQIEPHDLIKKDLIYITNAQGMKSTG